MATNLCKPPEPLRLTGNNSRNWREFKEQLQWFLAGTESTDKPDAAKIGIMLSHAGKDAREVFKTLPWAAVGDDQKFDKVLEAFERCTPQKNILYERHGFWSMQQEDGESVDSYLTRLKLKIDYCEYDKSGWPAAVKNELTRDKFVFGLIDDGLQERLLRESDLSLERAVALAQRSESSKIQVKAMASRSTQAFNCDEIQQKKYPHPRLSPCGRCGKHHKPRHCPAYGQQCSACHKLHHFAIMCRNKPSALNPLPQEPKKRIHTVEGHSSPPHSDISSENESTLLIDPLKVHDLTQHSAWLSTVATTNGNITCKLDTGAEASVLPISAYNQLPVKPQLKSTNINLSAYGGSTITPIGTCLLQCQGKDQHHNVKFYVVTVDSQPILGLRDCEKLGLIKKLDVIETGQLTKSHIKEQYKNVFTGLGNLGKYHITLKESYTPVINPPRRIPHSLKERLRQAIDANVKSGVLVKVDEPTDWVHNLVVVEKKNGSLRLCLDPKNLNHVVKREHYRIPTIQEIASEFAGKSVFSTLDLKDGYWQVELDRDSSFLCTFATPFGRYRFTRMPFGLNSASEVFQKRNEEAFEGIEGIHIVADDIIIAASDVTEHDRILHKVLQRAVERNVKLNFDKLQLRVSEVKYLGTIITHEGMKPDPPKVKAITEIPVPQDKAAVRRLLGMINFLASHIPNMATITAPLRELMRADVHFEWTSPAENALNQIKDILSTEPVLHFFDPSRASVIQADASQHGLGACLFQNGKPIAYASRSLSTSERNYAQIEKELLAIVFACTKFHQYIYGFLTKVQTDHKPLEVIFKKPLHQVSPRLQRMLLRLQKYELDIKYVKGKYLNVADTLSRAHTDDASEDIDSEEVQLVVHTVINNLPVSDTRIADIRTATVQDTHLQQLRKLIDQGWPTNLCNVPEPLHQYWKVREDLCIADDLILKGDRIVVPSNRQSLILKAIHEGHLGIEKCKARARICVYWPHIDDDIEQAVKQCSVCNQYARANQKEPLLPHSVPERPWYKVGADHFTIASQDYLLVVDYFSKYPEVIPVSSKSADSTIIEMKAIFARHGVPNTVIADNMPFGSKQFQEFSKEWNFNLVTSSPRFPQSNGMAERNVQTIKNLYKKAKDAGSDEQLALLEFRNSPIAGLNVSPAELLMGRRLQSTLPMLPSLLEQQCNKDTKEKLLSRQTQQKYYYDKDAKQLPALKPKDVVRFKYKAFWKPAVVIDTHSAPRSYIIRTADGTILRRNRRHLRKTYEQRPADQSHWYDDDETEIIPQQTVPPHDTTTTSIAISSAPPSERRSRYGRLIRPPVRYGDEM